MRSFVEAGFRLVSLPLAAAALSGCGIIGADDRPETLAASDSSRPLDAWGPAADYPMVLGEPFTVEGELFTPADTLNYDAVGYVTVDQGSGVSAAHRTLPLPSYAEVTSLDTGKTILVRIERRGPMAGKSLVALAPAALAQLGAGEGTPVRLRRVNPPEAHRAELRAGPPAPERIETPKALVEVLRRKLPASGAASLRIAAAPAPATARPMATPTAGRAELPATSSAVAGTPQPVTAYPLPPLAAAAPEPRSVIVARAAPEPVTFRLPPAPRAQVSPVVAPASSTARPPAVPAGAFVIQAGAFASEANAQRAAKALNGFVSPAGKFFRVRTGPFSSRGQAEAALAKVRAAGYSDARVTTAG